MTAEDMFMIEKIEKLAFQAGAMTGSAGSKLNEDSKPNHPFIAKLKALGSSNSGFTGTALYSTSGNLNDNIEWSEIIEFSKEK